MSKPLPFRIWCNGSSHLSQQNRGQWTDESLFFLLGSLLRFIFADGGKLQPTLRASSGMRNLQETAEDIKLKVFRRKYSSWKTDTIENARDLVSRLKKKLMGCKTSKRWSSHLLDSMRIEPLFLSSKLSWFFQNCLGCARMISLSHLWQVKAKQNG